MCGERGEAEWLSLPGSQERRLAAAGLAGQAVPRLGLQVCGLCGNYNGWAGDELLMPGGLQAQNVTQFGNSWKVDADSDAR